MRNKNKIMLVTTVLTVLLSVCLILTSCVQYEKTRISLDGWNYIMNENSAMDFIQTELNVLDSKQCYDLDNDRMHNATQIVRIKNHKRTYDILRKKDAFVMELSSNSFINKGDDSALFFFNNNSYYYVRHITEYSGESYKNLYIFTTCYATYESDSYSLIFPHIDGNYTESENFKYVDYTWSFLETYYGRFTDNVKIDSKAKTVTMTPIIVDSSRNAALSDELLVQLKWGQDKNGNMLIINILNANE